MEDPINNAFGLPMSNRGYKPFNYIKSIILGLISGADCLTFPVIGYVIYYITQTYKL